MQRSIPSTWIPVLQAISTIVVALGFLFDLPEALIPAVLLAGIIALQKEEGAPLEYRPVTLFYALGGICFLMAWPVAAWTLALIGMVWAILSHFGHRPYHWLQTEVFANAGLRSSTHRRRT